MSQHNQELYNALSQLRLQLAKQEGIPAFTVFHNRALIHMAEVFPGTKETFLKIEGVELKADKFTPKDVGQMNFYLSAVDDLLRGPGDNPSIGLLLCKTKDKVIAEQRPLCNLLYVEKLVIFLYIFRICLQIRFVWTR